MKSLKSRREAAVVAFVLFLNDKLPDENKMKYFCVLKMRKWFF